jgi:hypothetical protein
MRNIFAILLLVTTTGVTTLQATNMTLQKSASLCNGTLGSITFSLGHVRVSDAPGVRSTVGAADSHGNQKVTFENPKTGQSAVATVNGHARSVYAKHVEEKAQSVACISPD